MYKYMRRKEGKIYRKTIVGYYDCIYRISILTDWNQGDQRPVTNE